jgi:hypothetical protein
MSDVVALPLLVRTFGDSTGRIGTLGKSVAGERREIVRGLALVRV